MSMDLLLVNGTNAATIPSFDAGEFIGVLAPGVSLLVIKAVDGRCNMGGLISTQDLVYAPGYVLTCTQASNTTLGFSGPAETRPAGTGGSPTLTLTAKTTANGVPKAGVAVSFTADVKATSGGHDHPSAARPKGTLSLAQGTTNANGELAVTFTAPEVAGIHTIKATCSSCTNTVVSQDVQVKVPNLVDAPTDTATVKTYSLVGSRPNHSSNHWFTQDSTAKLEKVIGLMYETGWGVVGVNDGSLAWGGRFDIYGNWMQPHDEHRVGNEVDISFNNPRKASEEQKKKTYDKLCEKNSSALAIQTLWHRDDGYAEHYHIYLNGVGMRGVKGGSCCKRYVVASIDAKGKPIKSYFCEETTPR